MEIKPLIVKNNTQTFKKMVEDYIKEGYEIKASNISVVPKQANSPIQIFEPDYYYYALLQKN